MRKKYAVYQGKKYRTHSAGETTALNVLLQVGADFEMEKTFPDLMGDRKPLRFDFYVKGVKGDFILEIDGTQHRKNKRFTSENLLRYDQMKDEYCRRKGIRLYRVQYCSGSTKLVFFHMRYVLSLEGYNTERLTQRYIMDFTD